MAQRRLSRTKFERVSAQKVAILNAIPDDHLIVWTDGSCGPTNPGWMGIGVHARRADVNFELDHAEGIGWGTNNIAELIAVERAIQLVRRTWAGPITIITDSTYVEGVVEKGWRAKENVEIIERLIKLAWEERVVIRQLPGHVGIEGNERADELASAGRSESERRAT